MLSLGVKYNIGRRWCDCLQYQGVTCFDGRIRFANRKSRSYLRRCVLQLMFFWLRLIIGINFHGLLLLLLNYC
jgi:hypothetical protein